MNPEVNGILEQLAKLNLIKITKEEDVKLFSNLLTRIRGNAEEELDMEEITKEVELVRQKRFDGNENVD